MEVQADETAAQLLRIEHELARGDGATYAQHLAETALVVVPGDVLDKPATVEAMDASAGWDEVSIGEESVRALGDDAALLTYRFRGRRGQDHYAATLSSAYVRDGEGRWKLAFHQQTPHPEGV
ncbi:MAG TPA: nuclear transport factor 2 family protein [Solirubrobacterales bacterium]|nr:nuclear transport factor 2 family protein [Solirubrobacterales bacterium]